ncbi:hypothetical protein Tco_0699106 [Tanacetum coccineum]
MDKPKQTANNDPETRHSIYRYVRGTIDHAHPTSAHFAYQAVMPAQPNSQIGSPPVFNGNGSQPSQYVQPNAQIGHQVQLVPATVQTAALPGSLRSTIILGQATILPHAFAARNAS